MSLLQATGVVRRFGGVVALDGVNLDVQPGTITAVIGPNGSGKTTLLNTLSGAYRPQAGHIALDGHALVGLRPHRIARLGLARTFQNIRLFGDLSVLDNVRVGASRGRGSTLAAILFGTRAHHAAEAALTEAAHRALDTVGLAAFAGQRAGSLPYVRQRLLEIARAIAAAPRLLLLDEPAAGMNMTEAMQLMDLVRRLRDGGLTVVMVEHNMRLVMGVCERVSVLDFGRRIAEGTPDEVRADPAVIAAYLGARHAHG